MVEIIQLMSKIKQLFIKRLQLTLANPVLPKLDLLVIINIEKVQQINKMEDKELDVNKGKMLMYLKKRVINKKIDTM